MTRRNLPRNLWRKRTRPVSLSDSTEKNGRGAVSDIFGISDAYVFGMATNKIIIMKISTQIVRKVVEDYDYAENCIIREAKKSGDISLIFPVEDAQMDLIYSVSAIVQDIIEEHGLAKEYADYPYVDLSANMLVVRFVATTFENA